MRRTSGMNAYFNSIFGDYSTSEGTTTKLDRLINLVPRFTKFIYLPNFLCIFSLRQGAILISSIQTSLSLFALILLVLLFILANDLVDLVTCDIEQFENSITFQKSDNRTSVYIMGNERKLLHGKHSVLILTVGMGLLLFISTTYFFTSGLLLYGAHYRSPSYLLPWLSMNFISIVTGLFGIIPICYFLFYDSWTVDFITIVFIYSVYIYCWLIVFSYYQQLTFTNLNTSKNTRIIDKGSEQVTEKDNLIFSSA